MSKAYSGVGSRETPHDIMVMMQSIARKLAKQGYVLRSGGAEGADTAFEVGALTVTKENEIFIPWMGFNNHFDRSIYTFLSDMQPTVVYAAAEVAAQIHPAWEKLSRGAKALHTRNMMQVLGKDLETPSKFLICWALIDKHGDAKGGTRSAWMLAGMHNIPRFNLQIAEHRDRIQSWLDT